MSDDPEIVTFNLDDGTGVWPVRFPPRPLGAVPAVQRQFNDDLARVNEALAATPEDVERLRSALGYEQ
ncbi:MAG: hypothetical protein AAGA99_26595 [Actinomycetota bacterium]